MKRNCDLSPAGYAIKSFPRLSRGGGIAVLAKNNTFNCLIFSTILDFDHSSLSLSKKDQFNFSASTALLPVKRTNYLILCFSNNSQNYWNLQLNMW